VTTPDRAPLDACPTQGSTHRLRTRAVSRVTSGVVAAVVVAATLGACGAGARPASDGSEPVRGSCPVDPVPVVVSVGQWSDVVNAVGGGCVSVTTVVGSLSGDPHEFEPRPSDLVAFDRARIAVLNGNGYDDWARSAVDVTHPDEVVEAAVAARLLTRDGNGDGLRHDPHLWYSPDVVVAVSDEVADALARSIPAARSQIRRDRARWLRALAAYERELDHARSALRGRTYVATEPLFDATAQALGLRDLTPPGVRRAAANGSEPSPGDLTELEDLMRGRAVDVLIVSSQSEGAMPDHIRGLARRDDVPVVSIRESQPDGIGFLAWQRRQLRQLIDALERRA